MEIRKQNITLLASLIGLVAISILLAWRSAVPASKVEPTLFQVADIKQVDRVELIRKQAPSVTLKLVGHRWWVNDSLSADNNMIDLLFATAMQAEPKRVAAQSVRDSVVRMMMNVGTKATFYTGSASTKSFYVWGEEASGITYFMDSVQQEPMVTVIPGYRVLTAGIFMQDAGTFREKRIFGFNWRNFVELEAKFPAAPTENFKVALSESYFTIQGATKVDTTALNNYLDAISLVRAQQFYKLGTHAGYDSLANVAPLFTITVRDVGSNEYGLQLYAPLKNDRSVLGKWGSDWVIFSLNDAATISKRRRDF